MAVARKFRQQRVHVNAPSKAKGSGSHHSLHPVAADLIQCQRNSYGTSYCRLVSVLEGGEPATRSRASVATR